MTRGKRLESPFHRQPLSAKLSLGQTLSAKISLSNLSLPASFSARISCSQNLTLSVSWLASLADDLSLLAFLCQHLSQGQPLSHGQPLSLPASLPGPGPAFINQYASAKAALAAWAMDWVIWWQMAAQSAVIRHCPQQSSPRSCEVCLGSCVVMWYGGKRSVGVQVLLLIHCGGRSWRAL